MRWHPPFYTGFPWIFAALVAVFLFIASAPMKPTTLNDPLPISVPDVAISPILDDSSSRFCVVLGACALGCIGLVAFAKHDRW